MGGSMIRTVFLLGLLCSCPLLLAEPDVRDPESGPREIIEMEYVVKAPAPEAALRSFRRSAEAKGGHLVSMESTACTVDVPAAIGIEVMQSVVRAQGLLLARNVSRRAVSAEIADLRARIKARREHLTRLEKLFADVDLAQTLALESETASALRELDKVQGQLNYLTERSSMLRVTIRLETSHVARGRTGIPLAAPWVGSLTLENFLSRFGRQ